MGLLDVTVSDGVCVAVINNPRQLNALNRQLMDELLQSYELVNSDPSIKVLVLTGSGRSFCAGADIGLLEGLDSLADSLAYVRQVRQVYAGLEQVIKPVIAAVNGYALGGGLELCLCCDLVIAAEGAVFGAPEVLLGAIPGFAVARLPGAVGRYKAAEMMMLGDSISASEAASAGLVNRVVEPEKFMDEAMKIAHRLALASPLAVQAIKATMRGSSTGGDMTLFLNTASSILATGDAKRGMEAFAQKRAPHFEGN